MCGIIAVIAKAGDMEKAREALLNQWQNQHGRGNRGFGLIEVTKGGVRVRRAVEPIKANLDVMRSEAGILLFHHRNPTSTENNMQQTHPIFVSHPELKFDYLISHNGVIRNSDELKRAHEALGYKYTTEEEHTYSTSNHTWSKHNDSEAFAIELCRFHEEKQEEMKTLGPAAFHGVKMDKKTGRPLLLMFGRADTNPLDVFEDNDNLIIASDIPGRDVIIHKEKTMSVLPIKAILTPKLWPAVTEDSKVGPLTSMLTATPIVLKAPPVTHVSSSNNSPKGMGFQTATATKPMGLLEAGRKESDSGTKHGNATVKKSVFATRTNTGGGTEDTPTQDELETPSPRELAFAKMATRTTEAIALLVDSVFNALSEAPMEDEDLKAYLDEMGEIIKSTFEGAERARFNFDKHEQDAFDSQMARQIAEDAVGEESVPSVTAEEVEEGTADEVTKGIERATRTPALKPGAAAVMEMFQSEDKDNG